MLGVSWEDIPKSYQAKIQVYEHIFSKEERDSSFSVFHDPEGDEELLPGIVRQGDQFYKTWAEDVLKLPNFKIIARQYEMRPLQSHLDIEMNSGGRQG